MQKKRGRRRNNVNEVDKDNDVKVLGMYILLIMLASS